MPSYNLYKKMLGSSIGEEHKRESDLIMEKTWDTDIATRDAYFYDWYHDSFKEQLNKLHPELDTNKISMRIKYLAYSSQTMDKDMVSYHLQMKPSQECVVPYYDDMFGNKYGALYPIGLYCDIQDSHGDYNRWLVVAPANYNDAQFPTYELLRCDYVVHAIIDNTKYYFPVVLRSQNSYNSGIWSDYLLTSTEDQIKFVIPLNTDTEKMYYGQRLIIDANVESEPRVWRITKVNRVINKGVAIITCAQVEFNESVDYRDPITGIWWADYNAIGIEPSDYDNTKPVTNYASISYYSDPVMKIGGGYKKFTADIYDKDGNLLPAESGTWDYSINGVSVKSTLIDEVIIDTNQIKAKFTGDISYIGNIITITYTSSTSGLTCSVEVELKRL